MNAKWQRRTVSSLISLLGLVASGCHSGNHGLKSAPDGSSIESSPDAPIGRAGADGARPVAPGTISVSSPLLYFGTLAVGETSLPQVVTVSVLGPTKLDATATGTGFAISSTTCTSPQPVGTCALAVTFTPMGIGAASGVLTVGDAWVALSGVGVSGPPAVFTATEAVELGEVLINQAVPVAVRITPVSVVSGLQCVVSSAALSVTSQTCPAFGTLSESCTLNFAFLATTVGQKSETVVCTAGGRTTQTLVTADVVTGANMVLDPPSVSITTATCSTGTATFTLANTGRGPTGKLTAAITGQAIESTIDSNECSGPLPPLSTCRIHVTFRPFAAGSTTGILSVSDQTSGQSAAATLLWTVWEGCDYLSIAPATSDFGQVLVKQSKTVSFTVKSLGGVTSDMLQIGGGSSDFIVDAQTCKDVILPPTGRCTFAVTFAPTSAGPKTAALILTRAGVAAATAQVTGIGVQASLSTSTTTLALGTIMVGTQSGPRSVTVTNSGTVATGTLRVVADSPSLDGGASPFAIKSKCSGALAPGASCTIDVFYAAGAVGTDSATITVTDGTVSSPPINVTGTTFSEVLYASLCSDAKFADTPVGGTSPEVVCTASPPKGLDGGLFTPAAETVGDFTVTSQGCTETLCTVTLVFRPSAKGVRSGSLTYNVGNGARMQDALTGKGI